MVGSLKVEIFYLQYFNDTSDLHYVSAPVEFSTDISIIKNSEQTTAAEQESF